MKFDADTLRFMEKIAGEETPDKEDSKPLMALRQVRSLVRNIKDPGRAIGKALVSKTVLENAFEKEGAASIQTVFHILNDHYKNDWWDWEPETIWQTLTRDHSIEPFPELRDLILAIQLVLKTDQAFENWHIFENVGHAFNLNPVNFGVLQPLELDEIALTLRALKDLRPKAEFEDEIYAYIAAAAKHAGVVYLPFEYFGEGPQKFLDRMDNDLELKGKLVRNDNDGSPAFKIQTLRLKEIANYVAEKSKE